jgi:adenosylcobinamide kinase / adenosylcobinamide-phosphate guanylyltransferase
MPLTLFTGGARSGKSALALRRGRAFGGPVVFIATAEARDAEMDDRIARHRAERDTRWATVEAPLDLAGAIAAAPEAALVIVDCLSLWVANLLERAEDERSIAELSAESARLAARRAAPTVAVTNEVGMGVVPPFELGRRYRDVLGRVNAGWAAQAVDAYLVVAGRTLALGGDDG